MTIREVDYSDAASIADIYNYYVLNTTITFETKPVSSEEMKLRIKDISSRGPYFVCVDHDVVLGYCYVHGWKEKAAYRYTNETTVYVSPDYKRHGVGSALVSRLIESCRDAGLHALIACITQGNEASVAFHKRLGFERVSRFREVGWKFGKWLDVEDYELIL